MSKVWCLRHLLDDETLELHSASQDAQKAMILTPEFNTMGNPMSGVLLSCLRVSHGWRRVAGSDCLRLLPFELLRTTKITTKNTKITVKPPQNASEPTEHPWILAYHQVECVLQRRHPLNRVGAATIRR